MKGDQSCVTIAMSDARARVRTAVGSLPKKCVKPLLLLAPLNRQQLAGDGPFIRRTIDQRYPSPTITPAEKTEWLLRHPDGASGTFPRRARFR